MKRHPTPDAVQQLEYCLPAFVMKFAEPGRYVQFRIQRHDEFADVWLLEPREVRDWVDRDGRRVGIAGPEREALVARIVTEARSLNLWLGVVGQKVGPRPKDLPPAPPTRALPALPVPGEEDCMDGEDIAIAAERERASRPTEAGPETTDDPELKAFIEYEMQAKRVPVAKLSLRGASRAQLGQEIESALAEFRPMAERGLGFADSIVRQLEWCRGVVAGEEVEAAAGPFSMGDIAFRELNMHGDRPDLADRVIRIQDAMLAAMD